MLLGLQRSRHQHGSLPQHGGMVRDVKRDIVARDADGNRLPQQVVRTVADGRESYYVQGDHAETFPGLWTEVTRADSAGATAATLEVPRLDPNP